MFTCGLNDLWAPEMLYLGIHNIICWSEHIRYWMNSLVEGDIKSIFSIFGGFLTMFFLKFFFKGFNTFFYNFPSQIKQITTYCHCNVPGVVTAFSKHCTQEFARRPCSIHLKGKTMVVTYILLGFTFSLENVLSKLYIMF